MTFDLNSLIREELASSPIADPHIVSEHVLKRIRDEHTENVWDALAQCLAGKVREMATNGRFRPSAHHTAKAARHLSAKCDSQKRYRELLAERLEVGDESREWKWLRDCTRDDILRAAKYRSDLAAKNAARADQLEKLAERMRVYRAETVADLDAGLLIEVFG